MRSFKNLVLLLAIALLSIGSAYAFNSSFLQDTPLYYFTKQDWDLSRNASYEALNYLKDGKRIIWQNPQTGASGYAQPSHTQGNCRHLKIFNQAESVTSVTEYKFCKVNAEWKIVGKN